MNSMVHKNPTFGRANKLLYANLDTNTFTNCFHPYVYLIHRILLVKLFHLFPIMKHFIVFTAIFLLVLDDLCCQQLEAFLLGKAIKILSRVKIKAKDKKKVKYGIGAVKKGVRGTVAGVLGKPLKIIGILLGPFGKPFKIVGGALKTKKVVDKTKAGVLTIKKWSRDSMRYG